MFLPCNVIHVIHTPSMSNANFNKIINLTTSTLFKSSEKQNNFLFALQMPVLFDRAFWKGLLLKEWKKFESIASLILSNKSLMALRERKPPYWVIFTPTENSIMFFCVWSIIVLFLFISLSLVLFLFLLCPLVGNNKYIAPLKWMKFYYTVYVNHGCQNCKKNTCKWKSLRNLNMQNLRSYVKMKSQKKSMKHLIKATHKR